LRSTLIILDKDLVSKSLITSAKTPFPNKVIFIDAKDVDIFGDLCNFLSHLPFYK
jgi:hypothetical protein